MKLIDDLSNERLRMLIYGRAGSGKTRLAASAALVDDLSPVLLISRGGNPVSIRDYEKKPVVVELGAIVDFNQIYDYFRKGQPSGHSGFGELVDGVVFKTLIIDGSSEVNRLYMNLIMKLDPERSFDDLDDKATPDVYRANLDSMALWGGRFFGLADKSAKLPIHVILTALEKDPAMDLRSKDARADGAKGPSPSNQLYRPLFYGAVLGVLESYAYIVARMVPMERVSAAIQPIERRAMGLKPVSGADFVAIFAQGVDYVAKDQYGRLGQYMVDPTMDMIWQKIK